jgi:hypothetical protein
VEVDGEGIADLTTKPKPTGLASFTTLKPVPKQAAEAAGARKKRGQGATVSLTVRVARADWVRLRQLADAEGTSVQEITMEGFTKVMVARGLPPIEGL